LNPRRVLVRTSDDHARQGKAAKTRLRSRTTLGYDPRPRRKLPALLGARGVRYKEETRQHLSRFSSFPLDLSSLLSGSIVSCKTLLPNPHRRHCIVTVTGQPRVTASQSWHSSLYLPVARITTLSLSLSPFSSLVSSFIEQSTLLEFSPFCPVYRAVTVGY